MDLGKGDWVRSTPVYLNDLEEDGHWFGNLSLVAPSVIRMTAYGAINCELWIAMNCEIILNCEASKLLKEFKSIAYMEFS